jgi:hypothetical protein
MTVPQHRAPFILAGHLPSTGFRKFEYIKNIISYDNAKDGMNFGLLGDTDTAKRAAHAVGHVTKEIDQ